MNKETTTAVADTAAEPRIVLRRGALAAHLETVEPDQPLAKLIAGLIELTGLDFEDLFVVENGRHPEWCLRDDSCTGRDEDGDPRDIHHSAETVISDTDDFPVSVRLERWGRGVEGARADGITYSVEINTRVDVPIEHARALGEYLIDAADKYGPEVDQ